jgi:hypothetical protein
VEIDSFATFDSITLNLGEHSGWRAGISWSHAISPQIATALKDFCESWDLGGSGDAVLPRHGVPAGTIYQPRIANRNYGISVELRRRC